MLARGARDLAHVGTATEHPARTAALDLPPNLMWLNIRALLISLVVLAIAQSTFSRLKRRIPERLL